MDIQKEWGLFVAHLRTSGVVTIEGNCSLKHNDIELMWETWQAAKAQAIPDGFVVVPKTNSDKGIESMAMRYRHDFPLLDADYQEAIKSQMRQLYEEAVGLGFYNHKAQESGND